MCRPFRKAAGFPCAARSARRPVFAAPPHPQGGGFSSCGYPQSGRLSVRGCFRKASGVRRATASARRRVFRVRSVPQGGRFSPRRRIREAAGFRRAAPPKRQAFRARSVPQGGRRLSRPRIRKAAGSCAQPPPRRQAFRARPVPQGVRRSPRRRIREAAVSRRVATPKAAGFPCAVRSVRRPSFVAPSHSQGGGVFRVRSVPQGGRFSPRRRIREAAGFRRAAPPRRRAFRARSVPQGVRRSPRHRIRKAAGFSVRRVFRKAAGFPCAVRFARRTAFAAPSVSARRRAFRVPPVSARRPALAAPAGGAAPPFRPPPAPRRRYTRRFPTCRTGTPTARSRDKASGSACPRCGRRGNIGPVPRRSTSFSPPLGPWGGASLSMPGRRKKRAGFAAARR